MSAFDEIAKSDYARRKKEFKIKSGEKEFTFFANELTYAQRVRISVLENQGLDSYIPLIVFSITDQDGNAMTTDQANRLSEEHFNEFLINATNVNIAEKVDTEKN